MSSALRPDAATEATAHVLGLDQHGAAFPTTSTLLHTIADLRRGHVDTGQSLILLAASISNATEIADVHGAAGLETVTAEVARRALQHEHLQVRLLRASPLGGFLAAIVVERELARSQVSLLLDEVRRLVAVEGDRVWPVVTVGARECSQRDEVWAAVRDVRATVFSAGQEAPGSTRWHRGEDHSGPHEGLALVRDLAFALSEHPEQLTLEYQPVYDLRGNLIVGSEALLRWQHPVRGRVNPAVAVAAAERTGLIVPLGRMVLDRALAQTNTWVERLGLGFRMHVNVSPLELREPSYVDHLEAALERSGVNPVNLLLEITETAAVTEELTVRSALHQLRDLGVGLGIDDFGTGYSSIAHLRSLPIDTVKLDRSLVSGIATESRSFTLARSVLTLVNTLGVTIVAEGIEDAVEAAHLQAMGCWFGQGFHLGRPVPADRFLGRLESLPVEVGSTGAATA